MKTRTIFLAQKKTRLILSSLNVVIEATIGHSWINNTPGSCAGNTRRYPGIWAMEHLVADDFAFVDNSGCLCGAASE